MVSGSVNLSVNAQNVLSVDPDFENRSDALTREMESCDGGDVNSSVARAQKKEKKMENPNNWDDKNATHPYMLHSPPPIIPLLFL